MSRRLVEEYECTDGGPTRNRFQTNDVSLKAAWYDYPYLFGSAVFYTGDVVTDILVSAKYFNNGDYIWFSLTLLCVVGASFVTMIFSLMWFYDDMETEASKTKIIILHAFQLGPLKR